MRAWLLPISLLLSSVSWAQQPTFPHPERIRYDGQCFTIDGHDTILYSGAFHYFRCPQPLWEERLKAIKNAGFNAVETYVAWNWSEQTPPSNLSDESKIKLQDFDEFLTAAEKAGLYTIVRPGPYICSEWATGGFPQWLIAKKPEHSKRALWLRSDDPEFLAWSKHWYDAVCKVVTKHQITNMPVGAKGTILFQVENEYDYADQPDEAKTNQVRFLAKTALDDGIQVPIFTCWTHQVRGSKDPILSQIFDTCNEYPRWDIGSVNEGLTRLKQEQPNAPKMITELQGGWFGQVGGQAASEQGGIDASQINAVTMEGLATGMKGSSYYMLFGGTNFGDWAAETITTSYDYNAPIREWGGIGDKYAAVAGIGSFLQQYGEELARAESDPSYKVNASDDSLHIWVRKAQDGARFVFVHNPSRDKEVIGTLQLENLIAHYNLPKFGFKVFRIDPNGRTGDWYPQTTGTFLPASLPKSVRIEKASVSHPTPIQWKLSQAGQSIAQQGIYGSEFVFYRVSRTASSTGSNLWIDPMNANLTTGLQNLGHLRSGSVYRWGATDGPVSITLENPGYPNGGDGMEEKRGIGNALLLNELPHEETLGQWHVLPIDKLPADVEPTLDTLDKWALTQPDHGGQRLLDKEGSNAVFRSIVHLDQLPKPGVKLEFDGIDDDGVIFLNGKKLGETHDWKTVFTFDPLSALHIGDNVVDVYIHNNNGIGGLTGPVSFVDPIPPSAPTKLEIATRLSDPSGVSEPLDTTSQLPELEHVDGAALAASGPTGSGVVRSKVEFHVDSERDVAWEMVLKVNGDAFLTLNGHPLGRYWRQGPQRAFFLPECWLKDQNVLEITAIPNFGDGKLAAAEVRPLSMFGG